jgi:hypothetical protein
VQVELQRGGGLAPTFCTDVIVADGTRLADLVVDTDWIGCYSR